MAFSNMMLTAVLMIFRQLIQECLKGKMILTYGLDDVTHLSHKLKIENVLQDSEIVKGKAVPVTGREGP
jgi:hypothetical protein